MPIQTSGFLQQHLQLSWDSSRRLGRSTAPPLRPVHCTLKKQGQRFIQTLSLTAGDAAAADHLMRKFVASSPKAITLDALSHLLSPDIKSPHFSSLALQFYSRISEASWFKWNPKLAAELISSLNKHGHFTQADTLTEEAVLKLECRERDLALFYCNLMESHCKHKGGRGFDLSYARLKHFLHNSSSAYVKRQAYESIITGLCEMGRPQEAEELMDEMRSKRISPSAFEFRTLVYGYGRMELFEEMLRSVDRMEREGFKIDTVCSNMVLSSYGASSELSEMALWLQRMKEMGIPLSHRTYNTVLNSCPGIMAMVQNPSCLPLSIGELKSVLDDNEVQLVEELKDSPVLNDAIKWDHLEAKVDLHGMHLGSAYLIMLQWLEEMKHRFEDEHQVVPAEVTVVCGMGKHSTVRGESPVKKLVREVLGRLKSPMRIDRKNNGCFVAKGRVLKDWLCPANGN